MGNKIGVYGLGVMGLSLARNIANHDYATSVYNIDNQVSKKVCNAYPKLHGYDTVSEFVESLETPRKIILMVTAGNPVDMVIDSLLPYLEYDDILIDCGNSFYKDTQHRQEMLNEVGIHFIGCGVSGGEKGALEGPSIMPSGDLYAYASIEGILCDIAAKNADGSACCTYIGNKGAGHFVKMVHNGIEYADMQLLAEVYALLQEYYKDDKIAIQKAFDCLAKGKMKSYLMDITCDILKRKEENYYLLDKVSDVAKQKGTGKWTSQVSFDYGVAIPSLSEAVQARFLSMLKTQRVQSSSLLKRHELVDNIKEDAFLETVDKAMYFIKMSIYAQGFSLITTVSKEEKYAINAREVANIWQNGCIIKSDFLKEIMMAFENDQDLDNLLLSDVFIPTLKANISSVEKIVKYATTSHMYTPIINSALQYVYGYSTSSLSTNLIQAQRDCFGAHTYERVDKEGSFHSEWE